MCRSVNCVFLFFAFDGRHMRALTGCERTRVGCDYFWCYSDTMREIWCGMHAHMRRSWARSIGATVMPIPKHFHVFLWVDCCPETHIIFVYASEIAADFAKVGFEIATSIVISRCVLSRTKNHASTHTICSVDILVLSFIFSVFHHDQRLRREATVFSVVSAMFVLCVVFVFNVHDKTMFSDR